MMTKSFSTFFVPSGMRWRRGTPIENIFFCSIVLRFCSLQFYRTYKVDRRETPLYSPVVWVARRGNWCVVLGLF